MSRISAASRSRCGASERRQCRPNGSPACSVRTEWYGPAATARKYVDSGGVVAIRQRPGAVRVAMPLPSTVHSCGAVTSTSKTAFRSGWSKAAATRCTSSMNSWV